ncbi:hypothetical protein F2Q69_00004059 [Brassica cretica]|uniref:Leucine-rich repeat-containing N-terminal plant-type domain-containing protein n=1 Tax=Brassica cretica TaxID=69181 RepID=A0A8S9NVW7_BRACR|nr:hypothetical protein F2Q69_00004059 [Brassica cretica]
MISNLTSLRSIHLHKCHLFGRLPLNALLSPAIKSIDLSTNPYLESYLPELNGSNSLVYLDLSETSLSGNIPDSIGNLKHLNVLKIQDSNITGKIPISIGSLSHLTSLILSSSKLSGSLPSSIGNLSYLNTLSLSSNNFGGEIPSSIQNLNRLTYVDVGNNEFTGTLPPNINSLSNFGLSGPLEIGNISSMSKLRELDLSQNDLTGPIPSTLFTIPSLETILVNNNQLNGPLKIRNISSVSKLQEQPCFAQKHEFSFHSFITTEQVGNVRLWYHKIFIRTQQYMSTINLSNNGISWLWKLPKLTFVAINNNMLSGFPKDLSKRQMEVISLKKKTNFSGEIPRSICDMTSLEVVDLSNNNFNGSVPHCLNNLIKSSKETQRKDSRIDWCSERSYRAESIKQNCFTGNIPSSLANLTQLESLDLSHNKLSGQIPHNLAGLSTKVSGFEDNTGLCGAPLDECRVVGHDDSPLALDCSCRRFRTWYSDWIDHWIRHAFPQIALVVRRQ